MHELIRLGKIEIKIQTLYDVQSQSRQSYFMKRIVEIEDLF